jgi:hypothetical protein
MFTSLTEAVAYAQSVQPVLDGAVYRLNAATHTFPLIQLLKKHGWQTKRDVQNVLRLLRTTDPSAFYEVNQ